MAAPTPAPVAVTTHTHVVYRAVRARYPNALDTAYSLRSGGRWNPHGAFPVLYTACSERVARAIVRDLFATGLLEPDDLLPAEQPDLVDVGWAGRVVDVLSDTGVLAAGFASDYPKGYTDDHTATQPKGTRWHAAGHEGVLCRSASLARLGTAAWNRPCTEIGEVAIFTDVSTAQPRQLKRRTLAEWYYGSAP